MKKYFFLLFIIVGLFLSCKKEKSEPCTPTNYTGMLPLHVGNQWIYQVTVYDSPGSIFQQTYETLKIVGDTVIDCETKYFINNIAINDGMAITLIFGINNLLYNTNFGFNTPNGFYPYPISPGNKTVNNSDNNCNYSLYYSYDTLSFYDSLANKSFFCNTYSLDSSYSCHGKSFTTSYYCFGIGLVVQKIYFAPESWWPSPSNIKQFPGYLYITMELVSYTLF